ncbi:TPA: pilus assembly/adherence protein PilC [Neisseria gonorrhoeae]|uniref:PilC family type IV pilus tip adhesin n=1 Tax=Neisseria gonorrhoeae TaxID=485 RepID=UPI0008DC12F6|nr:PilC family type IV pilus tip adhesin [Neisseria gonorrhoeae]MDO6030883.1 PilC family type IV pilus tip adhesin [Neisseria gonorrhoeae]MDO6036652.1 PilC family type IV pilus tip adhesin [Neisseria gonorrhoeae]MDO6040491.1 PilC family type IV pilus tip adhesin [Neisseria gonorrhoeae]OIA37485.1 pilus assembly protein [Neisseria gonorrhoeae]SNU81159.1 PilC2 [Neisseria gonorrhoeae]
MNKTLKRRVFRHTALYTAILMFSHTGGGGAMAQTHQYAIIMNERKQPEVKWKDQYNQSALKDKSRERTFSHTSQKNSLGITSNFISFNNNDELVSQQSGTAVFGTATYLPPYGKVSGFDTAELNKRGNAVNWIHTTRPGLAGYGYTGIRCGSTKDCPKLTYKTRFSFDNPDLLKTRGGLDRHTEPSRENSPIYKLKDYPWLGVSFNLGGEGTAKDGRSSSKLVSSFDENNSNSNQNLVYTTEDHRISLSNWQQETTAMAYYLNAKLHLLDKKGIKDITGKTVRLGVLKPSIDVKTQNTGLSGILNFWSKWDIKDNGQIPVKLGLPEVKAGRCINEPNPNKNTQAPSPALTAPALWFGSVQNGKVQMYSASVSTYPGSSSSRIFLQELKTRTDPARPGRHSLAALDTQNIKSREPNFNSRQTVIRLPGGVYRIAPTRDRIVGLNGNDGKNDTFGIYKDRLVTPEVDEWAKVLLPWTVRYYGNDDIFKTFNQPNNKKQSDKKQYSQKYRIRTKEDDNDKPRDLGDIVNSPITAVGGYLATSANDGMVHIFKKTGTDQRGYELKLSYIPGTMERKDIEGNDSDLAKELRAFAEQGYVGDRYGVDGGFVLRRITDDQDKQKHFFMFGAMGLGGRGAYALDLTKIDSNPVGVSMFDVQNDKNNNKNDSNRVKLGYTVGTPQIGKTQNGKYAAFLASGYAAKDIVSSDNTTALYVYDLKDTLGTPIAKIEAPGGKGGLSSPTLVDKDLDGTVDIAYAGDRGGNMYRFDLSSDKPSEWAVRTIFEGTKPITSAPAVSRLADKRVVIFGTGSDLSEEDVVGKDQQYIYGIFDDDKGTGTVKVTVQNGTGGGLLEQTLTKENNTLFLSNNKASGGSADKGWVVKLREGERVTVKPTVVLRTAFVTIRKYKDDGCGADTAILGINTADGGALTPRSARPIVPDHNSVAQYSGHKKTTDGKSVPIGCMWKNSKTVCPNGYVYDKPVNVRYLDEKKTDDFPVTADGDAGGSGTFKEGKKPARNNRCFSGKGVRTLLMNDLDSLDITGPMCGIKRLSWREVFF